MLITSLNPEALKRLFSPSAYQGGQSYYQQDRISQIKPVEGSAQREVYTASVQGRRAHHYRVRIEVSASKKGTVIQGICSCFLRGNCKHVVAALLAAHFQSEKRITMDTGSTLAEQQGSQIAAWLQALQESVNADIPAPARMDDSYAFIYLLGQHSHGIGCTVQPVLARRLKSGGLGAIKNYNPAAASQQKHLQPSDKALLVKLEIERRWHAFSYRQDTFTLLGEQGESLLLELIATGRCYHLPTQPALKKGAVKTAEPQWQMDDNGMQTLQVLGANASFFLMEHLWYIDFDNNTLGLLETGLDKRANRLLLSAPKIPPEQAKNVVSAFQQQSKLAGFQLPQVFHDIKTESVPPLPCLHLLEIPLNLTSDSRGAGFMETRPMALARLSFRYQEAEVDWQEKKQVVSRFQEGSLTRFARNTKKEAAALNLLLGLRLPCLEGTFLFDCNKRWGSYFLVQAAYPNPLEFSQVVVPKLRADGWQVTMAEDYPYQILEAPVDEWYSSIHESSGYDWFDLELGIIVKGEKINVLPLLQQLLHTVPASHSWENETADSLLLKLPDGRFVALPRERVNAIMGVLFELYDDDSLQDGSLRLSTLQAARLLELQAAMGAAQLRWFGGESLRQLAEKLAGFTGIEKVVIPPSFQGTLRPYQHQGVNWLQFLREYGLSGILADDMGLGKTVQTLAHLLLEKTSGRMTLPSLIVAPTSLMFNWQMEAQRFAPNLKTVRLHGSARKNQFDTLAQADLVLTTYPLLLRDKEVLLQYNFYYLILDEAQCIKNSKSLTTQIVQQLPATYRLCLTGTPLENHLGELWSLFHFMLPGLLGSEKEFNRLFRLPIEKQADKMRRAHLNQRIAPFLLRRTKANVVKELPAKVQIIRHVELEGAQRDLYETIRSTMQKKVQQEIAKLGLARSHIVILDALLKLRQVCCDPRLVRIESAQKNAAKSAKLALLMALIPKLLREGRRILLFSQFTKMLRLIEKELISAQLPYVILTGKTVDRATPVQSFQNNEVPLFLISLKAGGTGLNLTAADTVIHYDPWWNPAVENQATDRAHRIGQDKTVFVYKLLTKDTVEEKILWMQQNKQALIEGLFSESAAEAFKWTAHDLQALFEPLHARKIPTKPLQHKEPALIT